MIGLVAFAAAAASSADSVEEKFDDKSYFVAGKFYKTLDMHLSCDLLWRDGKSARPTVLVKSVNADDNKPTISAKIDQQVGEHSVAGDRKGLMAYSLPISSVIQLEIPVDKDSSYNQRFMSFTERFNFETNQSYYVASIVGTKEDLSSVDAVGFCSIDSVVGSPFKGKL